MEQSKRSALRTEPLQVKVDKTWLPINGAKCSGAVVLDPKGGRLDPRLSDPGLDWAGWSLAQEAEALGGQAQGGSFPPTHAVYDCQQGFCAAMGLVGPTRYPTSLPRT